MTNGQTDRQTEFSSLDRVCIACSAVKTELRQIFKFFSYFREYIENFSEVPKPLTDLTAKQVPANIPWKPIHQHAFDEMKRLLCNAATEPLYANDFSNLFVDASGFATSSILSQTGPDGMELPTAVSSTKLNATQCAWSTIEREGYAALMALEKYQCKKLLSLKHSVRAT